MHRFCLCLGDALGAYVNDLQNGIAVLQRHCIDVHAQVIFRDLAGVSQIQTWLTPAKNSGYSLELPFLGVLLQNRHALNSYSGLFCGFEYT